MTTPEIAASLSDAEKQLGIDLAELPDFTAYTKAEYIDGKLVYTPISEAEFYDMQGGKALEDM